MLKELGIYDLDNWKVIEENDQSIKAIATLDAIEKQGGTLSVELIALNKEVDFHKEIKKIATKKYGKPNVSVPIEDNLEGIIKSVTYGFVYSKEEKDTYVVCKLELNPKGTFLASIKVNVDTKASSSSFLSGNMNQEFSGKSINNGELIACSLTLREITVQETRSEEPTSAKTEDFKTLEWGMSEEQVYSIVGLPNKGLYDTQKTYNFPDGRSAIINFSHGGTDWAFILNNDESQESLF